MAPKRKAKAMLKKAAKSVAEPYTAVQEILIARKHNNGKTEYLLRFTNGNEGWYPADSLFVKLSNEIKVNTAKRNRFTDEVIVIEDSASEVTEDSVASDEPVTENDEPPGNADPIPDKRTRVLDTPSSVGDNEAAKTAAAEAAIMPPPQLTPKKKKPVAIGAATVDNGPRAIEAPNKSSGSTAQFEKICKMRKRQGQHEFLVKLAHNDELQWTPKDDVDEQMIIAFYEKSIKWQ